MGASRDLMAVKEKHYYLNSYAIANKKGKVSVCTGYMCFADFNRRVQGMKGGKGIVECYLAISQAYSQKEWPCNIEAFKRYLKYLMCKSMFKDHILTKRLSDAKQHGISFNCKSPHNWVMAAMVAVRRGWEMPKKLITWDTLVQKGVHPDIALIMSYFIEYDVIKNEYVYGATGYPSNHELFSFANVKKGLASLKRKFTENLSSMSQNGSQGLMIFETMGSDNEEELKSFKGEEIVPYTEVLNAWSKKRVVDMDALAANLKIIEKELYVS